MKFLLSPNAFKGSLSATEAAEAMARGAARACPGAEVVRVPVSDGGDGLIEVLTGALGAERHTRRVEGPRGDPVDAGLCLLPGSRTAVIEMAAASGLALLPEAERDPTRTSTAGTGELIAAALDLGARRVVVGVGGSATCDGGMGMASALGVRFLDAGGKAISPSGGALSGIERIEMDACDGRLCNACVEVACDVQNPLLGPSGAARVYGPQKGATPEQVEALESGMEHLASRIQADLGVDVRGLPGGGAAGGLGAGLHAFLGASLRPGTDLVLELVGFEKHLRGADLVLTAEGKLDEQTPFGKAPAGVAARAKARGIPCFGLAGSIHGGRDALRHAGMTALFSICPGPMALADAMKDAAFLLEQTTEEAVRGFLAGRRGIPIDDCRLPIADCGAKEGDIRHR